MNITAATAEIQLGDKKYTMSPLTDKHIEQMDMWLRTRTVRIARDSCVGLNDQETAKIMRIAFEYANSISWAADGSDTRFSIDGLAQLIYVSIKDNHVGIGLEEIKSLILDPRTLQAVMDQFDIINDINHSKEEDNKADPTPVPLENGTN